MPRSPIALSVVLVAAVTSLAGCRHAPTVAAAPATFVPAPEQHCWWAAYRTTLPPDSVAARYARAFTAAGLSGARVSHLADTAWAEAGPTVLARPDRAGTYVARVVALRRGDSTFFRPFVSITLPRTATAEDSARLGGQHIGFCGEIGMASQTHGTAPRTDEREDSLALWRRRQ
jgi:hypothetical protein